MKRTIMKFKKIVAAICLSLLTLSSVNSQVVGPDVYMQGNYLEIGVRGDTGYEGIQTSTAPVPGGYHPRGPAGLFGFVANPQMNAWLTYDGDFFTPGSPENGWGFEIITTAGISVKKSNNCAGPIEMSGFNYSYVVDPVTGCKTTSGTYPYVDASSGFDISFDITYKIKPNDLYYTTVVTITNNSTTPIPEFYYYRNVDPDNNQTLSGTFTTTNTIVSNPTGLCNKAHVSATMATPWLSYLGFAAVGPDYRVSKGGFANRDGSDIWNATGGLSGAGVSTADEAISLGYRILNFAPGTSETLKFVVILDAAGANSAIDNLFYFDYTGSLGGPAPECVVATDTAITCSGNPVTITLNSPITSDFTWAWSPAAGLSTTTGTVVDANPSTTTTYTITGTSISGCYSPITESIVVETVPGPDASYIDPGSQCNTFDLSTLVIDDLNNVTGAVAGFYTTVPATLADTALGHFTGTIITPADSVYIVYYDPILGCINSELINLTWGVINATLSIVQPSCIGNDGQITVTTSSPGTYTYNIDGGIFGSSNIFTGLSSGIHTIIVNDALGCSVTLDTTLINNSAPNITSTINVNPSCVTVCNGTVTVNATGINTPFTYSINGGLPQTSNVFTGVCDGLYTITLTDSLGCTVTSTGALIASTFTLTASSDVTICIGQTTTLSTIVTGGSGGVTVIWDNGLPNGSTNIVDPTGTTTYSVYALDGTGCVTTTESISVTENPPLSVTVSTNLTTCPDDTVNISSNATGGNGGPYTYTWTNDQDATILSGSTQTVSPNVPTVYTVTVIDNCGTPSISDIVVIDNFLLPFVTYTLDNLQGCSPLIVNFTNTTPLSASATWLFGDGTSGTGNTVSHIYTTTTITQYFDITLTVTTVNGCTVDTTINNQIEVYPYPVPNFSWNPNPTDIFNVNIDFVNLTLGGTTYDWDFAGLGTSTDLNPNFSFPYDSGGVYPICLVATNIEGCPATICHDLIIGGVFIIYVPNSFTPDASGTNDTFLPIVSNVKDYSLQIFNRWGQLIFESNDTNIGWNGQHGNTKAKEDVYVWKIKLTNDKTDKRTFTGHVTLLR